MRQTGLLVRDIGNSSTKGFVFGDAVYWAPTNWADATLGAQDFTKRGSSQRAEVRMRPSENTSFLYTYYGVIDRGIPDATGILQSQGGHQQPLAVQSLFPRGSRLAAGYNPPTSL